VRLRSWSATAIAVLALAVAPAPAARAQTPPASGPNAVEARVSEIETFVAEADQFAKQRRGAYRLLGDIRRDCANGSGWREFKTADEFKTIAAGSTCYETGRVLLRGSDVLTVHETLATGEWVLFSLLYFRPDGSLARLESSLDTSHGQMTVLRRQYFLPDGRLLKAVVAYRDRLSQQPLVKPNPGFEDVLTPVYQRAADLPYAALLKSAP